MGVKTYELARVIGLPYGETLVAVLTKRKVKTDQPSVEFYSGDLNALVENQLNTTYRNQSSKRDNAQR